MDDNLQVGIKDDRWGIWAGVLYQVVANMLGMKWGDAPEGTVNSDLADLEYFQDGVRPWVTGFDPDCGEPICMAWRWPEASCQFMDYLSEPGRVWFPDQSMVARLEEVGVWASPRVLRKLAKELLERGRDMDLWILNRVALKWDPLMASRGFPDAGVFQCISCAWNRDSCTCSSLHTWFPSSQERGEQSKPSSEVSS